MDIGHCLIPPHEKLQIPADTADHNRQAEDELEQRERKGEPDYHDGNHSEQEIISVMVHSCVSLPDPEHEYLRCRSPSAQILWPPIGTVPSN